jgi:hypothetical protein
MTVNRRDAIRRHGQGRRRLAVIVLALLVPSAAFLLAAKFAFSATDSVSQALDAITENQNAAARSQAHIDALVKDTRALREQARQADAEAEQLRTYVADLEKQVQIQEEQKTAIRQQIAMAGGAAPALGPLLKQMIESLDRFVASDLPFLQVERRRRIADLRAQMERGDQPLSGKLRAVVEAYQVEVLYGRTLEAYPGELTFGKTKLPVDFLRVGRLMLFYRSSDGTHVGFWDRDARKWKVLDAEQSPQLERAIQVVQGGVEPELLELPLPAAKAAP